MKFITKVNKNALHQIVMFSDIEKMKAYQCSLIDFMLYETKRDNTCIRDKILFEIQSIERWMKMQTVNTVNNKKRDDEKN
jgi:hypothetical protein